MSTKNQLDELNKKVIGEMPTTPLGRCWAIRNYFGTISGRYDIADQIGATVCDMMMPFKPKDKMTNNTDDDCTEYWEKTKLYLLNGR